MNPTKEPQIVYEDNHLIAVNKPAGMPSQGDISGDVSVDDWTKEYIRKTYHKPGKVYLALLHRIDRPTSGLMVLAKTSKAAGRMSNLFKQRKVHKTYLALTDRIPSPPEGELVHYLRPVEGKLNIMRAYRKEVPQSKKAKLTYEVIRKKGNTALVEIKPYTGRKHQIRVQLSSMGCAIRGDKKYGAGFFNPDKSICLLAQRLDFVHPTTKEEMSLRVPVPTTWELGLKSEE